MTNSIDQTDLQIDLDAARRQTQGGKFTTATNELDLLNDLRARRVSLPPHSEYEFGETIDWDVDPFKETNWCAQWYMLRWIDPLRRAADSGRIEDGRLWTEIVESWIDFDESGSGSSIFQWKDMTDAFRARTLIAGLPMVAKYFPAKLERVSQAVQRHGEWLANPNNHGHSNHLMHQLQALFACGRVLKNEQWTRQALEDLQKLFNSQHDSDGINREGAIAYHLFNHKWWREVIAALQIEGFSIEESDQVLQRGIEELVHATTPGGELVRIGDTGLTKPIGIDDERLRYVLTAGADGIIPEARVRQFQASGYLYARSGWGEYEREFSKETYLAVPYGRNDKVHGHKDAGSIIYFSQGVNWLADPGKYGYGKEPIVKRFLSRDTHNLISIEKRKFDPAVRIDLVNLEDSPERLVFTLVDRSYSGVEIHRQVVQSWNTDALVVVDTVRAEEPVVAHQRWLVDSGIKADRFKRGFNLRSGKAQAKLLFGGKLPSVSSYFGDADREFGWVATGWKQKAPAHQIELEKSGKRFRFITVLVPSSGKGEISAESVSSADPSLVAFDLNNGRVSERLVISKDGVFSSLESSENASLNSAMNESSYSVELRSEDRMGVLESISSAREYFGSQEVLKDNSIEDYDLSAVRKAASAKIDLGARAFLGDFGLSIDGTAELTGRDRIPYTKSSVESNAEFGAFKGKYSGAPLSDGIYTFDLENLRLAARIVGRPGSTLTVLFQGAIDRAKVVPPIFQRLASTVTFARGPVVSFYDASLDQNPDLRLGWYLGNERLDLQAAIAAIVRQIAVDLNVENFVCVGSSGGGFAAMQVATLAECSAIVFNPQSDLRNYHRPAVEDAMRTSFGCSLDEAMSEPDLLNRISVMARMENFSLPRIRVVANVEDGHHWRRHVVPLRDFYREHNDSEMLAVDEVSQGKGHVSVPTALYEETLKAAYA